MAGAGHSYTCQPLKAAASQSLGTRFLKQAFIRAYETPQRYVYAHLRTDGNTGVVERRVEAAKFGMWTERGKSPMGRNYLMKRDRAIHSNCLESEQ